VKKVSRFKYATWNIRGLREKEELNKILNENIIKLSVITESKRNYKERKRLNNIRLFTVEWTDRHVRGQSGVTIWIHKSISNNIDHYTFGTTEL
jgi:exonuclease III